MTNEQRRQIKSLCRQIEVVRDETLLFQTVCELQELISRWLCELHHPPKIRQRQADALQTESRVIDNRPRFGCSLDIDSGSYEAILDDAAALMRADYASLQMLYPERGVGGELWLVAFRGFSAQAAAHWEWVRTDSHTTCGMALRSHRRVVAPDLASCDFMVDSEDQKLFLQAGIHASQSTPLLAPGEKMVGMISTHWRRPHQPSETDFRLLDVLARQAADFVRRDGRRQKLL